jgi:hypothetical protein
MLKIPHDSKSLIFIFFNQAIRYLNTHPLNIQHSTILARIPPYFDNYYL